MSLINFISFDQQALYTSRQVFKSPLKRDIKLGCGFYTFIHTAFSATRIAKPAR